jgi:hypothetical protein
MGFLAQLFRTQKRDGASAEVKQSRQRGALVHVFLFDSGPASQEESRYVNTVVRSLLPEAMAYENLSIAFFRDENMPVDIGNGGRRSLEKATDYPFAWKKITAANSALVEGLKVGNERITFACEEYSSESGNRGILYAFYELTRRT